MKQKNKEKGLFLDNKRNVFILALFIALVAWVIVALFINPNQEQTYSVPINYSTGSMNYKNRNLEIVGNMPTSVEVSVQGDGNVINNLETSDFTLVCDYDGVTSPGEYEIPLRATPNGNFEILEVKPKTVTLTFESVTTGYYDLNVPSDGITVDDTQYHKGKPVPSSLQVEVRGPDSLMERVYEAVAVIDAVEERTTNYSASDVVVQLLDINGEPIQSPLLTIEPSTVSVEIPILPKKTLDISVGFIGTPPNFDVDWFRGLITMSENTIEVAGDNAVLENKTSLDIGSVDISVFTLANNFWKMQIGELENNLRNLNTLQEVELTLDTSGLAQRTISVPMSQVTVKSEPSNLTVAPASTNGDYEVTLIGPEDVIYALTSENIAVEIDASNVTEDDIGQIRLGVRVYVPSSSRVYSVNVYEITCRVALDDSGS